MKWCGPRGGKLRRRTQKEGGEGTGPVQALVWRLCGEGLWGQFVGMPERELGYWCTSRDPGLRDRIAHQGLQTGISRSISGCGSCQCSDLTKESFEQWNEQRGPAMKAGRGRHHRAWFCDDAWCLLPTPGSVFGFELHPSTALRPLSCPTIIKMLGLVCRDGSTVKENLMLFKRTQVRVPAPTRQLRVSATAVPGGTMSFSHLLRCTLYTHICVGKTQTQFLNCF